MWTTNFWGDFDSALDEIWRSTDRALRGYSLNRGDLAKQFRSEDRQGVFGDGLYLSEKEDSFEITAIVPGIPEDSLNLSVTEDALNLAATRKTTAPENYSTHRQERIAFEFDRSIAFPSKVDPDRVKAQLEDGVLRINVAKSEQAKPRQITVQAAS